jgi:hypothetical protein
MPSEVLSPAAAREILASDQATALAYVTPASGTVIVPVTNFATFDPAAGTISVNTSIGAWRKLDRIRRDPHVALAFHTREHSLCERPEYLLAQGRAELSRFEDRHGWQEVFGSNWERFGGQPRKLGRFWEWWLAVYHWRVTIEVHVERVVTWTDLRCAGEPSVSGAPLPAEEPPPQAPPGKGTRPRMSAARVARRTGRLPNVLLGWVGADGYPLVVPVEVAGTEPEGILLRASGGLVPPGGRRAGLTGHWFSRHVVGQIQHVHTGWLEARSGRLVYAPHTRASYRIPTSRLAFNVGAGFETRRRLRRARRAGLVS